MAHARASNAPPVVPLPGACGVDKTERSRGVSSSRDQSGRVDSNHRPLDPQSSALTRLRYAPGHQPTGNPGVRRRRTLPEAPPIASRSLHPARPPRPRAPPRSPRPPGFRRRPSPTRRRRPRRTPRPRRPSALASRTTVGAASTAEGCRSTSAAATHASASRRGSAPANSTFAPSSSARRASAARSGPSPTTTSRTPAAEAAAIASPTRFDGISGTPPPRAARRGRDRATRAAPRRGPRSRGTSIAGGSTCARRARSRREIGRERGHQRVPQRRRREGEGGPAREERAEHALPRLPRRREEQPHVGAVRDHVERRAAERRRERERAGHDPVGHDPIDRPERGDPPERPRREHPGGEEPPRRLPRPRERAGPGEERAAPGAVEREPALGHGRREGRAAGRDHVHLVPRGRERARRRADEMAGGIVRRAREGRRQDGDAHASPPSARSCA